MFNPQVVLYQPEIPQNTGNIVRTCAAVGAGLHLIRPLGFSTSDRYLKRAGLDYWHLVKINYYENLDELFATHPDAAHVFITKKASQSYDQINYSGNIFLIFGRETTGVPEEILQQYRDRCYRLPMKTDARSLNLSNAAAIVLYEGFRQNGFFGLKIDNKPE